MDLCEVDLPVKMIKSVNVVSDIVDVQTHPRPNDFDDKNTFQFPLAGEGPYLCTQGCGGQLTHFAH